MNLTYLLGAGASALSIPTVNEIKNNQNLSEFGSSLDKIEKELGFAHSNRWSQYAEEIKTHFSFDTYARMLSLEKNAKYIELKLFIELFILHEQLFTTRYNVVKEEKIDNYKFLQRADERHLPWLLNFLLPNKTFAKNIKILTWNYDLLLFSALSQITNKEQVEDFIFEKCITHLNGRVGLNDSGLDKILSSTNKYKGISTGEIPEGYIVPNYYKHIHNCLKLLNADQFKPSINYAWDELDHSTPLNILNSTKDLVIIGYSLPLFNRTFDRSFIEKFIIRNLSGKFSITIQDKFAESYAKTINSMIVDIVDKNWKEIQMSNPENKSIKGFDSALIFVLNQINIIPLEDTRQFHVPFTYQPE